LRSATFASGTCKPTHGILAKKTRRKNSRRPKVDLNMLVAKRFSDGSELSIQGHPWNGVGDEDVCYALTWTEDDRQVRTIGPLLLPNNALSIGEGDKRFVFL
jgi:hypothetical protein